ncbi:MurNAc alpha-1-phosphate uridylyltransferase [Litoreibacter ascidiaceicola]|uniref:MurNAc alpha-1-phosphate uridylyltransferase n=1 Tax=Litoreibacter ascidiaceicola TaxID=1486859 RepID=A0A1M5AYM0_9RHOB|nr:nucleotidyltransferase family protein [Litoreibacter ascidiaceicola]SHF35325.1 MurNAc alpha-1-phosphate uridylyltransferase [Litoreibacter ascidiaceicola]
MADPTAAMVFAAGFGTRMGDLTQNRPKPLIEVAGRALLDHALDLTDAAGVKAVVNAHYKADMVAAHVKGRPDTELLVEQPEILDTGGGLKAALPHLGNAPVFTLNSDAIWAGPSPLDCLREAWRPEQMGALLLLVPLERTVGYTRAGNFATDAQDHLTRSSSGMVYTGAQVLHTGGLAKITEASFSLNVLWDQMLPEQRLFGVEYPGYWADVGTPDGIGLAEKMLEQHANV